MDQIAHLDGVAWRCGVVAAGWLTQLTLGCEIKCLDDGPAGYAAIFGRRFLPGGDDIARLALEHEMAVAARGNGKPVVAAYGFAEDEAKRNRVGIWSSNFMHGGCCTGQG